MAIGPLPVAAGLLAAVILGSCDRAPQDRRGAGDSTELRIPIDRDLQTLDPTAPRSLDIVSYNILRLVYEGLVEYHPVTLEVIPRAAESWSISEDERTWSFRLRDDLVFSDDPCFESGKGREATADDVKHSMERAIRRRRGLLGAVTAPRFEGFGPFLDRRADEITGIRVTGPHSIELRLVRPEPSLLHHLARPEWAVMPREIDESPGEEEGGRCVLGTGPFRVASWIPASEVLLVRREAYRRHDEAGERLPKFDAIRFLVTWNDERLYALGESDVLYSYRREARGAAIPGDGAQEFLVPWLNTISLRFNFNSSHPVVHDRELRHAVTLAVPRGGDQLHVPARALLPPGLPGLEERRSGQVSDAERARSIVSRRAGPWGDEMPSLEVLFPPTDQSGGARLVDGLRAAGFEASLTIVKSDELRRLVEAGRGALYRDGWVADYPEAENFLQLYHSGSSLNSGGYSSPEFDRLFEAMLGESDRDRRAALARRAEDQLIADSAAAFLRHERQLQLVSPRVAGWQESCTNPINVCYFERLGLREPEGR